MDTLFFHPKLVHLPVALGVLMPLITTGLLIAWWRKWLPARSWVIALILQAMLLGSGIMGMRSGEAEEERVEEIVSEHLIEEHEEAAEAFVWGSGIVLALMLVAFVAANKKAGLPLAAVATLGTLVVFGLGYRTGQAGGELVYRHGAATAYVVSASGGNEPKHKHDEAKED
ncbi:MAG: hypothetical protein IPJ88_18890 [Myxococcales bacterium]|nr:MAG: hypothetical protein IPJ88_18890 [Myxococcales bacterium]